MSKEPIAAVDGGEADRDAVVEALRRAAAQDVARPRVFHLDDLGPFEGQIVRGSRPGDQVREVDDAHAFQ